MRRLFLFICLALLSGAFLFHLLQLKSGYVLISWEKTTIEMTIWMALLILLGSLLTIVITWQTVKGSLGLISAGASHLVYGHVRRGQIKMSRGLIDFIEGNWKQSKKQLLRSVKQSETPLINYLAAARSAYELGEHKEALTLLHKAEQSSPHSSLAVALTQARMQFVNKKYEQCVATLERIKKDAPKHPVVLDLLKQSYTALRDWKRLQEILPELRRQKVYTTEDIESIENDIYQALMVEAAEQARRQPGDESLNTLQQAWQLVPSRMQQQADMVDSYVLALHENKGDSIAENVLRRVLNKNWSEKLVRWYGLVNAEDQQKQLLTAEDWLKERPGNASLMLTLGRLCLRNELWGKARDYFESSLRLQRDPETFAELARLLAHLGEHEKSTQYYQQGLLMMTNGLPELPMPQGKNTEKPMAAQTR